ncbi:MAG: hypothetical protein QXF26_06170 [Candidatus Bathyarchaeia archaeon]
MSEEEEVKELADLKRYLEEKAEALELEASKIRALIQMVDDKLAGQSFKKAHEVSVPSQAPVRPAVTPKVEKYEEEKTLEESEMVYKGLRLGEVKVYRDHVRFKLDQSLRLQEQLKPFEAFLINKILEPMREKDLKRAADNLIRPDQVLSYNIERDGIYIDSLVIRNYGDRRRLNEIIGAVRWTFYSMAQKVS